jgi:hypothetical protein
MQLGRDDQRQKEEDRDADRQGMLGLYGALPVACCNRKSIAVILA